MESKSGVLQLPELNTSLGFQNIKMKKKQPEQTDCLQRDSREPERTADSHSGGNVPAGRSRSAWKSAPSRQLLQREQHESQLHPKVGGSRAEAPAEVNLEDVLHSDGRGALG